VKIEGCVALVTGANRGLGLALARALVEAGAATVYGGARSPATMSEPGVVPVQLDVTHHDEVARLAAELGNVDLVVNNAGVMARQMLLSAPDLEAARVEMEVNYFGTLAVSRAFAPVLARNGGGAIVNVLSVVSLFSPPGSGSYAVSKAAEWSMTNAMRSELAGQGTLVLGVHSSFIDTDMAAGIDVAKNAPGEVARQVCEAVEAGATELLVDDLCRHVKASLARDHEILYSSS